MRCKESGQACTRVGVFVYGVSAWVEACLVQHGFVSVHTGNKKGDWVFSGPGTLG